MTTALSRIGVLLVVLLVPLGLAAASQALAERPGAPRIDQPAVRLEPAPPTAPSSSAAAPTAPPPTTSASPPESESSGPRVVDPQVVTGDDDADDAADDEADDDADDGDDGADGDD